MTFSAYPAYKDSGVEWLGDVPEHWEVGSLRRLIKSVGNGTTADQVDEAEDTVAVSRIETISTGQINFEKVGHVGPLDVVKRFLLNAGDILFSHINSLPMVGNVAIYSGGRPLLHGMNLLRIQPLPSISSEWLLYWLKSKNIRQEVESRAKPSINQASISTDSVRALPALIPPSFEQTQIARFLDHETARIDALIEEQQRLIELLKEKRQAVISHAVTKGLDPTVPMKDSGVEWLGEVPAHWEVTKFKWPLRTASGGTPPSNDRETYYDGGIPWLRSLDLTDDLITEYEVTVTQRAVEETACKVVPKSSVLIAMYGGDGTIGKNGLLTFDSAINQAICAFLPSDRCAPEYLHRYIQFYRPYWMIGAESSRKDPNIGQDRIGDHFLVLPSPQEQSEIVAFLGVELLKFSVLIKEAQTGVEFLQERRSALISAAVTGKIDVSGWQPPVSIQEPEPAVAEAN